MTVQLIFVGLLGLVLSTTASADSEIPIALEADDECSPDDEACAVNALQLRARMEHVEGNESTSLLEKPSYKATCFAYTGGTCVTGKCDGDRQASCVSGKCVCSGCAGPDGKCYSGDNRLVSKGFVLRNAKYSHYKMYFQRVSTFGQMKTTRLSHSLNMNQDSFDLWELPGERDGRKMFFLGSAKWTSYVVGVKATTGTALSPFGAYAIDLKGKASIFDVWGPSNMMLRVCSVSSRSPYKGGVQIGAVMPKTGNTIWAYVHHGSWYVYGSMTSPGTGGIWLPEPPLPDGAIPPCDE